ncbi:MAG: glycerol-3-phosphate acyltransferase, partial [Holophaga sp.]|nr:glycerol-3-phosphate acyltransferase [Holophaga sp.]
MHTPTLNTFLLWCLASYLAGSIPFGLILVKLAGKGDVRAQGSGNIGATNVMRAGGKWLGILTLVLDAAK